MEFYKAIGSFDQWSLRSRDGRVISEKEKSKIIEMFPFRLPNKQPSTTEIGTSYVNMAKLIYDVPKRRFIGALDDKSIRKDIEIYVDNDEYYYIKIYSKVKGIVGYADVRSFYKCDQWYGLIKCIEEKIII